MDSARRWHVRGVLAFRRGTASRWVSAAVAERLARRDALDGYADDLCVDASHVRRMRQAYLTYVWLRDVEGARWARAVRRVLTLAHFSAAGELARRYDIPAGDVADYLDTAAREQVSARLMREMIEQQWDPGAELEWQALARGAVRHVQRVVTAYGVPERVRVAGMEFLRVLGEWCND